MLSLNAMLFNSVGSSLIACKEDGRAALSLHGAIVRKMSPQRTLFILVLIVLDVDQMGGHLSVDASVNEVSEIQRAFDRQLRGRIHLKSSRINISATSWGRVC